MSKTSLLSKQVFVAMLMVFCLLSFSCFSQMQQPIGSMQGSNANLVMRQVQENNKARMFAGSTARQQQMEEYRRVMEEFKKDSLLSAPSAEQLYIEKSAHFQSAFQELMRMQQGHQPYSLKRAIFLVENAYFENRLDYNSYCSQIASKVALLRNLMKKEQIAPNSLGKNFAIQKLFSEGIKENGRLVQTPLTYDFDDPWGDKDWSKMFVSKLLNTGTGQCHSLALLYVVLAEEMGAKAWACAAPSHFFVSFNDNKGGFFNFETTNGYITSNKWVMASGYINSNALRNKTYLDTLDHNDLLIRCMADLHDGYIQKLEYDGFVTSMVDSIIDIDHEGIEGYVRKADFLARQMRYEMRKRGLTSYKQFPSDLYQLHVQWKQLQNLIEEKGYASIPKEEYEAWRSGNPQKTSTLKTDAKN